ncbi:MAG: hypothetical protein RIT81_13980 [Deltaproteobacteria bacterium]
MFGTHRILVTMTVTFLCAPSALAAVPMGGYARFVKTKRVEPAEFRAGPTRGLDGDRRIMGRSLALFTRGGDGAVGVELTNGSVTALRTIFEVRSVAVPECTTGASATFTQRGRYFNAGVAAPGDATGDVQGFVRVRQTSETGPLSVEAGVEQCDDASCSARTVLGAPVPLGTLGRDAMTSVALTWDPANDRFVFQLAWGAEVTVPYAVSDANAAGRPSTAMEVETTSTCAGDAPRIDARVQQVWVDASAL